jgi:hypothetical protein
MTKVSESVMCKIEGCGRKAMYREHEYDEWTDSLSYDAESW